MKTVLLFLTLCGSIMACSGDKNKSAVEHHPTKKDFVELLYFHGAQRCATCMAIEKHTKELVETSHSEQLKSGQLLFRSIDITKEESLAEKYNVSWSSLILVDHDKSGKEETTNLTEFAFENARTAPDQFKSGLSEEITEKLNK